MAESLIESFQRRNRLRFFLKDFWTLCGILNRKRDFEQLIAWAKRKSFPTPRVYYQRRLADEELRLWRYQMRSPGATKLAHFAVFCNVLLNPTSHTRYAKGYAAKYKMRNLKQTILHLYNA